MRRVSKSGETDCFAGSVQGPSRCAGRSATSSLRESDAHLDPCGGAQLMGVATAIIRFGLSARRWLKLEKKYPPGAMIKDLLDTGMRGISSYQGCNFATSSVMCHPGSAPDKKLNPRRPCSSSQRSLTSALQRPPRNVQQIAGHPECDQRIEMHTNVS